MKSSVSVVGLTAALASSLCCVAPALAVIAGSSSAAASFGWLEPFRPYMIGLTVILLTFAWYQQLRSRPVDACGCEPQNKPFIQTKTFLGITSLAALLLLTYPSVSGFASQQTPSAQQPVASAQKTAYVTIKGMTCSGCEQHVKQEVSKIQGVGEVAVSYAKGNATVKYDDKKTSLAEIKKAVNATGYKATDAKTL